VDTQRTSDRAEFTPGNVVIGDENTFWAYGQAAAAITAGVVTYNGTTFAISAAAGAHTAPVDIASGDYAWVRQTLPITA
ncbi:MAG: hypothetical protein ABUJ98_14160, partial [Hyphomicrobium sp.]